MQKTLLLVVPPQAGLLEGFSSGIIALGNYIRLYNHKTRVKFVDLGPIPSLRISKYIQEALQDLRGLVFVGITGTTASYQNMLLTARAFKHCAPEVVTIFGGHHATAQDDVILKRHSYVDFVVRGEGEIGLSRLLQHHRDPTLVPNLSFRDGDKIVRTADAPLLDQFILDKLDPVVGSDELLSPPGKFNRVTYVSARGCPLKCSFCVVQNSAIRAKSVPAVIQDLRYLTRQRGYKRIAIEDNFFAHQPRRTLKLCAAIERLQKEMNFYWNCQTRVESMRRGDIVRAMARANCDAVYLGVESLVAEHLQFLGKTLRPTPYLESLRNEAIPMMMSAGIDAYINLQLGIPNEDQSHREATLLELMRLGKIARHHGREIAIHPQLHVIYPGTPHFEKYVAAGTFGGLGNEIFEEFTSWEENHEPILNYFGEHFAHGVGGIPIGILDREALRNEEFKIAERSISDLSRQLREMADIPGITVFQYGDYLTSAVSITIPAPAPPDLVFDELPVM